MILLALNGLNTSATTKVLLQSYSHSLKPSFRKISEVSISLLIISRVSLGKTPNIS